MDFTVCYIGCGDEYTSSTIYMAWFDNELLV